MSENENSIVDAAVVEAFADLEKRWALLTAGNRTRFNTMVINWGALGYIWNRPVMTILVRPNRYTYEFIEKSDTFTVSFYDRQYRKALGVCGTKSGRDIDKVKETGFTPIFIDEAPSFAEADLTIVGKKLFRTEITRDNFLDASLDKFYPEKDYHTLYQAEIVKVVKK